MRLHYNSRGKIEVVSRIPLENSDDLSLAYTPGVAAPCLEIAKSPEESFNLTRRSNLVAVITDGTAVLGLGDIGPLAAMPVMEGKCALFKSLGNVDAFPICIDTKDTDEAVRTIELISGSFGGINLEDIAAPRCFEIEKRLSDVCGIPVFHDDCHGTAVVVLAALINALKLTDRKLKSCRIVINGAGAAGTGIARLLLKAGARDIIICDRKGAIYKSRPGISGEKLRIAALTNPRGIKGDLACAMENSDVFIGVSSPNCVSGEMVEKMSKDPILFPLANPVPEISYDAALAAGAAVVGTGRSDYPNQINNVLVFPGIFRGALDAKAKKITDAMKIAAAKAIAALVPDEEIAADHIIPDPLNKKIAPVVARAAANAWRAGR